MKKLLAQLRRERGGARIAFKKMQTEKKDEYAGFYRGKIEAYTLAITKLETILTAHA